MSGEVAYCATSNCWECGREVKHRTRGAVRPMRWHACRLRWLSRARWKGHQGGWHEGYRFAVENRDDELVLADSDDYGSGWAAFMRGGGITVAMGPDAR